jgi:outer membrane protein assembly factor BamB
MKKTYFLFCLTIISYILINCSQSSQDQSSDTWPNFRGVNGSGIASPKQNPPVNFGPEQNVIWKLALPEGHSSPCIWGKNIFMTGFDKEKKLLKMFCIDRNKGKRKWEKSGAAGAYFASPVAANGMIYIASRNGIVTIIGAEDTLKIISRNNLGDIITATPALVDNKLYLRTNKTLYAFGKR